LLDSGVPDSVGSVFQDMGHTVIYHRELLEEGTPDPLVAAAAMANEAILVAIDKDMNQIVKRYGVTPRGDRFDRLSLIHLCCNETLAAKRLAHVMSFIEHEWEISTLKASRRMWVAIAEHFIRSNR
jgi:hypothetical protein